MKTREKTHLHYDYGFLDNVADSSVYKFQKNVDASFCCSIDFDRCLADGFDTLSNKIHIDF